MKRYWTAAIFAFFCLAAAAVWMGGLNQDEGWYLYAANLVGEGKKLYRDFAYTQGPLMPYVYSVFGWVWGSWGLLGARVLTLLFGALAIAFAAMTAARLVPKERRGLVAVTVVFLLGCNLYHLYYIVIPKTYALASLWVALGFWLYTLAGSRFVFFAGLSLAFAAGTRISLGAILAVIGFTLLFRRDWKRLILFSAGGFFGLGLVYLPYLVDSQALAGLVAAQKYHAARGGFDPVFTIGSFSRLIRWYLPLFIVLGLGIGRLVLARGAKGAGRSEAESGADGEKSMHPPMEFIWAFGSVFAVQMLAPFPYEDYQVPIMGLLAVVAAVLFTSGSSLPIGSNRTIEQSNSSLRLLLVLGLAYAAAFGSPLLEEWMTNGQDRFWSLKKSKTELVQLRDVAKAIEALDPGGKTLLTQDLYLAVETGRKVPEGLEMGPFSVLDDAQWKNLLENCSCEIAALSGYTFAVNPPACDERPIDKQMEYWNILKRRYEFIVREDAFGQNATPLLILKRK